MVVDCQQERVTPLALTVESIASPELLYQLETAWQALHEQVTPRTPFTTPLWNAVWWKHYQVQRLAIRDTFFVHVVKDERGALIAVAPLMITERPSMGPLRIRVLQCFGTDRNITEIRGPVCRSEHQISVVTALAKHFSQRRNRAEIGNSAEIGNWAKFLNWDWMDWGSLQDDGIHDDAQRLDNIVLERELVSYQLLLPASWEEFRATRSRNIKESLRKCYNTLKREGLSAELRVVQEPGDCAQAMTTFFRLHHDRASAMNTVAHPNVFRSLRDRAFINEYALEMAKRGQLRIFQLCIAREVVATRLAFVFGDELYLYYSGYDLKWAKFSVMTTLLAEALKWAVEQKIRLVNLSVGADVSKLRWHPTPTIYRSAVQVAPGLRSRLAYRLHHGLRSILAKY
jgi:CelD/BcsL family acetyltransferase involved in cellulose biosynthesis